MLCTLERRRDHKSKWHESRCLTQPGYFYSVQAIVQCASSGLSVHPASGSKNTTRPKLCLWDIVESLPFTALVYALIFPCAAWFTGRKFALGPVSSVFSHTRRMSLPVELMWSKVHLYHLSNYPRLWSRFCLQSLIIGPRHIARLLERHIAVKRFGEVQEIHIAIFCSVRLRHWPDTGSWMLHFWKHKRRKYRSSFSLTTFVLVSWE